MWYFKLLAWRYLFSQTSHSNGFSFVWIRSWTFKWLDVRKLLAHDTFIRFLVRVNTLVVFQTIRMTKTLLAHITFVRFLFRVNTHMYGQFRCANKHLLANIALVLLRPLSLPSLTRARFFSYLLVLLVFLLHHLRRQVFVVSRVKFSFLMSRIFP